MDPHWINATDKRFIKTIYDRLDSFYGKKDGIKILDLGVEYYNHDCRTFIRNETVY